MIVQMYDNGILYKLKEQEVQSLFITSIYAAYDDFSKPLENVLE